MKNLPVVLIVVGVLGLILLGATSLVSGILESGGELATISTADIAAGSESALVTVIEYSDFQCPACRAYAPLVKALIDSSNGEIRVIYRHFPLPQHKNAVPTAVASEAAARQGKFWEMNELIFARQDEWAISSDVNTILRGYAAELKLNTEQFDRDMSDPVIREKVESDRASGNRAGVNGTPTFFVNGKKIKNPRNSEEFKQIINAANR